jgi:mono/diheme cytochrome c family protein
MGLRGWMSAGAVSLLLVACGQRGDVDPRVPLGAHIVGAHPVVLRGAAPGKTVAIPSTASLPPATYTADQARLGKEIYESTCARCHPPGQLDGETFEVGWNERRVFDLYSLISNTMPQDKPGSLSDDQYLDVVAYLLQRNHVPAGTVALRADSAALKSVRIDVKDVKPVTQ